MDQHVLDLEDVFEEHIVSSYTVATSLNIEYAVFRLHGLIGAPPTAPQEANRLRGTQFLRALTEAFALPGGTREFSLHIINLVHGWSCTECLISPTDLLAMVASVNINAKLHFIEMQECFTYYFNSWMRLQRSIDCKSKHNSESRCTTHW